MCFGIPRADSQTHPQTAMDTPADSQTHPQTLTSVSARLPDRQRRRCVGLRLMLSASAAMALASLDMARHETQTTKVRPTRNQRRGHLNEPTSHIAPLSNEKTKVCAHASEWRGKRNQNGAATHAPCPYLGVRMCQREGVPRGTKRPKGRTQLRGVGSVECDVAGLLVAS